MDKFLAIEAAFARFFDALGPAGCKEYGEALEAFPDTQILRDWAKQRYTPEVFALFEKAAESIGA